MLNSFIEVSHLTKEYSGVRVVNDLTFSVETGKVTGFLGPNGAGKTTTLRTMLGLSKATSGQATFGGIPFGALGPQNGVVGAALGNFFHPAIKVTAQLKLAATSLGVDHAEVARVAELSGVDAFLNKRCGRLSLGMKQRLSLAQTLLGNPTALILDEPANGLDPQGIAWLRAFLRSQADAGRAVLVSSHQLAEAEFMVDDVVVINAGRLVRTGSLSDWRSSAAKATYVMADKAPILAHLVASAGGAATQLPGGALSITGLSIDAVKAIASSHSIDLPTCHEVEPSLEQLFFAATTPSGI